MTKYCQTASAGVWPCLLKSGLLKKSWRAGLVVCNPAQFLRGIFSGQMNTTLPKIEGRPLCSVLFSACYHTAPLWWAETDNHLCRSESSRRWRRTKLCWKRPGCFLLLWLLKWVRERDVKWKLALTWLLKHVKDFVSVWWWCRSAGIHVQLQITSFSDAETWFALKWDTLTFLSDRGCAYTQTIESWQNKQSRQDFALMLVSKTKLFQKGIGRGQEDKSEMGLWE